MLRLRAHHILCLHQFKGYGYNDIFIENMFNVINIVKNNQNVPILLVSQYDYICQKCPNLTEQKICLNENDSIINLDENVAKYLNLNLNTTTTFIEIKKSLDKYLTKDIFYLLCKDCTWYKNGYCVYKNFKDFYYNNSI